MELSYILKLSILICGLVQDQFYTDGKLLNNVAMETVTASSEIVDVTHVHNDTTLQQRKLGEVTVADDIVATEIYTNENFTLAYNNSISTEYYDFYGNTTDDYDDFYWLEIFDSEHELLGIVRPIFVLMTLITNVFVVIFFLSKKNRGKATNIILVSIAFSDTMTGISLLPNSIYVYGLENDELSLSWCNMYMFLKLYLSRVLHTVSIWQTVLLCLQRYMCVCHPFISSRVWTTRQTFVSIIVIYCLACIMHIYQLTENKIGHFRCRWLPEVPCTRTCVYLWFCVALQHFLPCFILILLTTLTILKLKKANRRLSSMSLRSSRNSHRSSRDRVITITTVLIVLVFLVPELPHGVYKLALLVFKHIPNGVQHDFNHEENRIFIAIYEILLVISFNANFWIYCVMMGDFRRILILFLKCRICKESYRKLSVSLYSRQSSSKSDKSRTSSVASRHRVLSQTTSVHSTMSENGHVVGPVDESTQRELKHFISQQSGDNSNKEDATDDEVFV